MRVRQFFKARTLLKVVLVLLVMVVGVQAGRIFQSRLKVRKNARVRSYVPYTVTLREIVHSSDGSVSTLPESIEAFRSDGSVVRQFESGRVFYFPQSGLQIKTNETMGIKTSMIGDSSPPGISQRDPISECVNSYAGKPFTHKPETFVGEEMVAGYRAAKIVRGSVTEWHALDYGCALVKDRWDFPTGDFSEKELVGLVGAEPNPTLFEVPTQYREVSPSEAILSGKGCPSCSKHTLEVLQKLDNDYEQARVKPQ